MLVDAAKMQLENLLCDKELVLDVHIRPGQSHSFLSDSESTSGSEVAVSLPSSRDEDEEDD